MNEAESSLVVDVVDKIFPSFAVVRTPTTRRVLAEPTSFESSNATASTVVPKRISTPFAIKYSRAFLKMRTSLSVPKCGFPATSMPSGAPNATRALNTLLTSSPFLPMRVVSFPSDHVPAPPSP